MCGGVKSEDWTLTTNGRCVASSAGPRFGEALGVDGVTCCRQVFANALAGPFELLQLCRTEARGHLIPHVVTFLNGTVPNGIGLLGREQAILAAVVAASLAFEPAVAFHAGDDACQRGSFDP